jgi:hypothetical protein
MKRDERGWTEVVSAPERGEHSAVAGARSVAGDSRQTSLEFPRHSAGRRGRNGLESPIVYRSSQIRAIRSPFTRHTMPSNFRSNSLKTNKSGTAYSTHNSRGREPRFRTLNFIDPPKFQQEQVN